MSDYISQTITVSSCQSDISNQCRIKTPCITGMAEKSNPPLAGWRGGGGGGQGFAGGGGGLQGRFHSSCRALTGDRESVWGRLLAVGNVVGAGVGVWECLWGGVRARALRGTGVPPSIQANHWGGGSAWAVQGPGPGACKAFPARIKRIEGLWSVRGAATTCSPAPLRRFSLPLIHSAMQARMTAPGHFQSSGARHRLWTVLR